MAHPSAQTKVDLRLTKGRLSYSIPFMKVEKSWHGSQMTLRAAKHICIQPDCSNAENSPVCCVLSRDEDKIMPMQPD